MALLFRRFRIILFLLLVCLTVPAQARIVIFNVYSDDSNKDYIPGDAQRSQTSADEFSQLGWGTPISFYDLKIDDLSELKAAIEGVAPPERVNVAGVIFYGHGNQKQYALNKDAVYSGQEVAEHLYRSLENVTTTKNFFSYFGACMCAQEGFLESDNLLVDFLSQWRKIDSGRKKFQEVHAMGHPFAITSTQSIRFFQSNFLINLYYRTGIPSLLDKYFRWLSFHFVDNIITRYLFPSALISIFTFIATGDTEGAVGHIRGGDLALWVSIGFSYFDYHSRNSIAKVKTLKEETIRSEGSVVVHYKRLRRFLDTFSQKTPCSDLIKDDESRL